MGSSQSSHARTATFENEMNEGPRIVVSDEVRQRLYQSYARGDASQAAGANHQTGYPYASNYGYPVSGSPAYDPYAEPYIRHMNQQELLAQNDSYWRSNMANMEQILHKTNTIMEQEFHKSYEQVQDTFARPPPSFRIPPCHDFKAKLFDCYRQNPGMTLKCFQEVSSFADCVNKSRVKRLDHSDGYLLTEDVQ